MSLKFIWGFPSSSSEKNLPAMQEMQEIWVRSLGGEDSLKEDMATHSSILARNTGQRSPGATVHGVAKVGHD